MPKSSHIEYTQMNAIKKYKYINTKCKQLIAKNICNVQLHFLDNCTVETVFS